MAMTPTVSEHEDETLTRIDKPETSNGGGGTPSSEPAALSPVQTGDRSGVLIWCIAAAATVTAAGIIVWSRSRKSRKDDN